MADIDIHWATCEGISIREVALQSGFNLSAADLNGAKEQYNNLAKSEVAKAILRKLDETWENQMDGHLADVCQGVYIISLSGNICFEYDNGQSQIIYIGKGWIRSRLAEHLKNWIAHVSESLQDMKMDISMAEIKIRNATKASESEEVESDLLEKFKEKYGEYPLLNKKSGISHQKYHTYSRHSLQPLHRKKALKKGWAIRPMAGNQWAKRLD